MGKNRMVGYAKNTGKDHEKKLFNDYKNEPAMKNRNIIVDRYLYLAEIISKKFVGRGIEYDDLYQTACIALIKAVERFDVDRGIKFVSFATPTIIGEIKRLFRDKGSIIRIPRRIYESYQKVNNAKEKLYQDLNRAPTVNEIASYLKMSDENILEIIESYNMHNIKSFDYSAEHDDNLNLHELVGSEDFFLKSVENKDFILRSLSSFNEIEKALIEMRYIKNMTQKNIAKEFNVSQMYVSRLEKKVISKFKRLLDK